MRSLTLLVLVAAGALAGCACDPGNAPVRVGERTLEPASVLYAQAHYFKQGLILDNNYDVTWVVVSEQPGLCDAFTAYVACDRGLPVTPSAPRQPEGLRVEVRYNSFGDRGGSIESSRGDIAVRAAEVVDGGAVFDDGAVKGSLWGVGTYRDERRWGSFDVTTDGGLVVSGHYSAERCDAMATVLKRELYDEGRCGR